MWLHSQTTASKIVKRKIPRLTFLYTEKQSVAHRCTREEGKSIGRHRAMFYIFIAYKCNKQRGRDGEGSTLIIEVPEADNGDWEISTVSNLNIFFLCSNCLRPLGRKSNCVFILKLWRKFLVTAFSVCFSYSLKYCCTTGSRINTSL